MAEPLLSLGTVGTMKHVVPWKTRSDFLAVYKDLYSSDPTSQESAIGRISVWKSRVGSKLSVAIESSGMLMQVRVQHEQAERAGTLLQLESQLRYGYSLALIRFVNHITEKAQTKAVAQPVHLVAREFGIPEWIVRLRHDATHGSLPCLDALASGAKWALEYLQQNFWEQQHNASGRSDCDDQATPEMCGGVESESLQGSGKSPRTADIRAALQEFMQVRLRRNVSPKKVQSEEGDKADTDHSAVVSRLQKYLMLNRMRFVKCLLEDGVLIATESQLQTYGVDTAGLLSELPPTIPQQMALLWRPLLKRFNNVPGALAFLLHNAMFSVTSEYCLRNYQLVAWIRLILANTSYCSATSSRAKRKRQKREDCYMRTSHPIPTRVLLTACIQNINKLTVHLLRHLVDTESLGADSHAKVTHLLQLADANACLGADEAADITDTQDEGGSSDDSAGSDSDAIYTLRDVKFAKGAGEGHISTSTVEDIERNIDHGSIQWNVCTDLVDWSTIPLGVLPDSRGTLCSDDEGEDDVANVSTRSRRRRNRRERRGDTGNDDDEDEEEDDEDSDDQDQDLHPKRSKLIVTDDLLI